MIFTVFHDNQIKIIELTWKMIFLGKAGRIGHIWPDSYDRKVAALYRKQSRMDGVLVLYTGNIMQNFFYIICTIYLFFFQ